MGIQRNQHAGDGRLDQILIGGFLDVSARTRSKTSPNRFKSRYVSAPFSAAAATFAGGESIRPTTATAMNKRYLIRLPSLSALPTMAGD